SEPAALFGGVKAPSLRVGQLSRQHGVKQLVADGMLVTLYKGEQRSTTGSRGLTIPASKSKKTASASSAVYAELAIDAEEIGPLTEALSLGTKMICVVRSGQPNEAVADKFSIEGLVPVITTARTVSAFSQLSDENLIDESTGQLHLYYFPAESIADSWITDPVELYGRVVARNLRRGAFLTEADLLPAGTRPGISAGLPIGMSALSIDKTHVKGFEKLAVGDHFSILTRIPDAVVGGAPATTWGTLQGGRMSEDDARVAGMLRTGIREIEHDAIY
ncbi:MAG: hypothetical protein GY875_04065, partial [Gammaproteobacteria bacterium]|nr:hypothetical protein [Gammaproteobacteria bacterium]